MADKIQLAEALATSGTKYAATALQMPRTLINANIRHMNVVSGLRGKFVQGSIKETGNYKPYATTWSPSGVADIQSRTLETYHLQYESEFDPEPLFTTIYSRPLDKIPMINQSMVKEIAVAKMKTISENMNPCIWKGVRDENSTTSLANFDGFATIIAAERAAGNISLTNGNLITLGGINKYNAGVKLQLLWNKRSKEIKSADMFVEDMVFTMYDQWYRDQNFNNANTDTDGVQYYLIGTEKKCRLVSEVGMEGMGYVIVTDGKNNMMVGVDGIGTGADATGSFQLFNPGNPKVVGLFTDCWMGVQFARIDKEMLMTASYNLNDETVYATVDPETATITATTSETKTVAVVLQGYNLTSSITVTISGNGYSCNKSTILASAANAANGVTATVTFTNATAGTYAGVLRFVSATDDVDLTVNLSATVTD